VLAPEVLFTSATCSALHQSDHSGATPRLHALLIALHWGFTLEREICSSVRVGCAILCPGERGLVALRPFRSCTSIHQHYVSCTCQSPETVPLILARPPRLSILSFLFIHRIFFSFLLFNPLEIYLSKIPFCLHLLSSLQHSPYPPPPHPTIVREP
jgi:hypothetical protein